MKKNTILAMLMTGALLLTACGGQSGASANNAATNAESNTTAAVSAEEAEAAGTETTADKAEASVAGTVTFTDDLGREVTVTNPQRVVTLLGSFCDEWLLAGGSVVGTASDTFKNYDFGFDDSVVDIGSHMEPDVEQILAANPDFVIASSMQDKQVELAETLENAGITVAYFYVNGFDDYLNSLKIMTQITGRDDLYEKNGVEVSKEIEAAKAQIDGSKPTVLLVRAAASSVKVKGSEGTVGGEILADLDAVNIADSESLLEDLSMDAIILADPDYIFVTIQGSDVDAALANVDELMKSNPAWESLKAVQNDHYYVLDKALFNSKPNARWGESYQQLADILYPAK